MIDPSENRKFIRMDAHCEMSFMRPGSSKKSTGYSINLSAAGILFSTESFVEEGSSLDITVSPINQITPPLNALIQIVRVVEVDGNAYEVAATIEGIKAT